MASLRRYGGPSYRPSRNIEYFAVPSLCSLLPAPPSPPARDEKVLIDLSKDDSIYYCGIVLGGTEDDSSSFANTRNSDQVKKI